MARLRACASRGIPAHLQVIFAEVGAIWGHKAGITLTLVVDAMPVVVAIGLRDARRRAAQQQHYEEEEHGVV